MGRLHLTMGASRDTDGALVLDNGAKSSLMRLRRSIYKVNASIGLTPRVALQSSTINHHIHFRLLLHCNSTMALFHSRRHRPLPLLLLHLEDECCHFELMERLEV